MILAIAGLFMVLAGSLLSYRGLVETTYVEAIGRSVSAEIREEVTRLPGTSTGSRDWQLHVEYQYWIGGEHFTSDRIASRRPSSSAEGGRPPSPKLRALLERYEAGSSIPVYVAPNRPERSILIRTGLGGLWILAAGLLALGAAAALRLRLV
ncbi:MAG: DUF3592 domain-containing protein [Erythrobacter sp.]|nr:DUF3592 domain-containing protein [Erythrobacter sp.]